MVVQFWIFKSTLQQHEARGDPRGEFIHSPPVEIECQDKTWIAFEIVEEVWSKTKIGCVSQVGTDAFFSYSSTNPLQANMSINQSSIAIATIERWWFNNKKSEYKYSTSNGDEM